MAGMFGLFDYTKEGPGVSKNGPKKRPFVVFFEIYLRKFWQLIQAGLLFVLVNLPLVTRGLADAGLTFVTRGFAREKHVFVGQDFFATIKKNRGQAFACGLINLLVTGLMFFNMAYYAFGMFPELLSILGIKEIPAPIEPGLLDLVVMGVTSLGYLLFTWMKYYIPFMVITFRLSLKQLYKNAFLLSIAGLKANVLISLVLILLYAIPVTVFLLFPSPMVIGVLILLWATLIPAFRSFLIQFAIFPTVKRLMIDPYYRDNPGADKQARIDLNLDVEETPEENAKVEDIPVFSDDTPAVHAEPNIPHQYSEREMRRFNSRVQQRDDDDDTI